jgi:deoxyribonuclease IV
VLLGVHVSIAGHIFEAVTRAEALGCTAMQIFSRDPRQWRRSKLSPADIAEFRKRRRDSAVKKVFVHVPYLVNLASPDGRLYHGSIRACIEDIKEAEALGVDAVVVHSGSHKKRGENFGLSRVSRALNRILEKTAECKVKILLENTAGSGSWLGYKFSHQRKIIAKVRQPERVGICLDTCHAFAAGFDLSTKEGFERMAGQVEREVGFDRLELVHLNDCATALGSHHDVHQHIGKGSIGLHGFRLLLKDARFRSKAFILETPKDSDQADRKNLTTVRRISAAREKEA